MPINPLYIRRSLEFYRNETVFLNKETAEKDIQRDTVFLASLTDGEPILARYCIWYELNQNNMYEKIFEPPQGEESSYIFTSDVYIELTSHTTRFYKANDVILVSNGDGSYDAFQCLRSADVGTSIENSDDRTGYFINFVKDAEIHGTTNQYEKFSTVTVLLGIATAYEESGNVTTKVTFIEDEEEIKTLIANGFSHTSPNKTINITRGDGSTEFDVNISPSDHVLDVVSTSGSEGLIARVEIDEETSNLPSNVRKRYYLKGKNNTKLGDYIDVYNNTNIVAVYGANENDAPYEGLLYMWDAVDGGEGVVYTIPNPTVPPTPSDVQVNDKVYVFKTGDDMIIVEYDKVTNVDVENDRTIITISSGRKFGFTNRTDRNVFIVRELDAEETGLGILEQEENKTYSIYYIDWPEGITADDFGDGLIFNNGVVKVLLTQNGGIEFGTAAAGQNKPLKLSYPTVTTSSGVTTRTVGGVKVASVNSGDVLNPTYTWEVVSTDDTVTDDVTDPNNPRTNGYQRYGVHRDVNGLAYVTTPMAELGRYMVKEAWGADIVTLSNFIVRDRNGMITTINVWDCGEYE